MFLLQRNGMYYVVDCHCFFPKFVHSQVNSKRLSSSSVYLFVWYVLKTSQDAGHTQKPKTKGNSHKKPENEVL